MNTLAMVPQQFPLVVHFGAHQTRKWFPFDIVGEALVSYQICVVRVRLFVAYFALIRLLASVRSQVQPQSGWCSIRLLANFTLRQINFIVDELVLD